MRIKWNKIVTNIKRGEEYAIWQELKKYFGDDDVNTLSLLSYYINFYIDRKHRHYFKINRVLQHTGMRIPTIYASFHAPEHDYFSLELFLLFLKSICKTHTLYCYICCMLVYRKKKIENIRIKQWRQVFCDAPQWLKIILDRQYRLAKNSYLTENDAFFFITVGPEIQPFKTHAVNSIDRIFERALGYGLYEYIEYFHTYAGMPDKRSVLIKGSTQDINIEIGHRRNRNIRSAITYFNDKRKVLGHGFCLAEIEPGIYLVHSQAGVLVVPFYMMDMCRIGMKHRRAIEDLYSLDYIPESDRNKIITRSDLTTYKIKLRRLNTQYDKASY